MLRTKKANPWTDERITKLRALWGDGKTASAIARILGAGITREAVCGKIWRLRRQEEAARTGGDVKPIAVPQVGARRGLGKQYVSLPSAATPAMRRPLPFAAFDPQDEDAKCLVAIMAARDGQCRWPFGEPATTDFRFCGRKVARGSYCEAHSRKAYQPRPDKRDVDQQTPHRIDGRSRNGPKVAVLRAYAVDDL